MTTPNDGGYSLYVGSLVMCEKCFAVVPAECSGLHTDWHNSLVIAIDMAASSDGRTYA